MSKASFLYCVDQTLRNGFAEEWARLRGVSLPKTAIERMIDEATGNGDRIAKMYLDDVRDMVWNRLPPEMRGEDELAVVAAAETKAKGGGDGEA